jgi:hypothetical protein
MGYSSALSLTIALAFGWKLIAPAPDATANARYEFNVTPETTSGCPQLATVQVPEVVIVGDARIGTG